MFWRIVIGLFIMAVGFHMVWKTDLYMEFIGRIRFAEEHMGLSGGTRLFLKLVGVGACVVGLLFATDLIQDSVFTLISPLFKSLY